MPEGIGLKTIIDGATKDLDFLVKMVDKVKKLSKSSGEEERLEATKLLAIRLHNEFCPGEHSGCLGECSWTCENDEKDPWKGWVHQRALYFAERILQGVTIDFWF